ncbi:MAG: response regulator transcription factor [Alphaproteobacteria bacterium]|nr:response regulator transcription factor [Alphaproteobacteria bacterium]
MREVVSYCLGKAGIDVLEAESGASGLALARDRSLSAVIFDLGLPDMDGLTLTQMFRQSQPGAGLIILTGRATLVDRVVGLEVGADDYVCKPFEPRELLARVRSVLRRVAPSQQVPETTLSPSDSYRFAGLILDVGAESLSVEGGNGIPLSSAEFALLKALVENSNQVLSRDQIIRLTHTNDAPAFDRSVDVIITRLRKKIDQGSGRLIQTIRNRGYRLSANVKRN